VFASEPARFDFRQSQDDVRNEGGDADLIRQIRKEVVMTTARELYILGLKNAHAMENQAHEILERQIERMGDYPQLQAKLREHLGETRQQLKRLEECLRKLDESPSTVKDTVMAFGSNMAAMAHAMAGDEVLKNTFANSALEHYEIAAYKSLMALSKAAGIGAESLLAQSLREEEEMASWVDEHVLGITNDYLRHEQTAAA
jgi:ferritin-like metal-binding protein YciE